MSSLPAGCPSTPITASTFSDPIFIIDYTAEEFKLCLSNEVLKANLKPLLDEVLPTPFLRVVKNKLDQVMGDTGQDPLRSPLLAWAYSGMGETRRGNRHRQPLG